MKVFIYALRCPISKDVRYVGKTINLKQRLRSHLRETAPSAKNEWIAALKTVGLIPIIEEIEAIDDAEESMWQERERFWISRFRALSNALTNLDSGGIGGKCPCPETRLKMAAARLGKTTPTETKRKMSEAQRRVMTAERRAAVGAYWRGRSRGPKTSEHKAKLSAALIGRGLSSSTRARMSEARRGVAHGRMPDAVRAKISASKIGVAAKPFTEDHRTNMKLAAIRREKNKRLAGAA